MTTEDIALIHDFLREDLSPEQRELVNQRLEADTDFKAAFLLEQQQQQSLDENDWNFIQTSNFEELADYEVLYKSEKTNRLKESINTAATKYKARGTNNRSNKWALYVAAAMVILMISLFSILDDKKTPQELYTVSLNVDELPGLAVRGGTMDSLLLQAEKLFNAKNYENAIPLLDESISLTDRNIGTLYLYKGVSHMELNQFEKAEDSFNVLIESDLYDAKKGYWYKALLYLKMDQPDIAKSILITIVENDYFNKDKALVVLQDIE